MDAAHAKIAFISANYGGYEKTCKPFAPQTVPCDWIMFTDEPDMVPNGWQVDVTPYHVLHRPSIDASCVNAHNTHTFCTAKFYKQSWHRIPRLAQYDTVIWLDGTIEVTNQEAAAITHARAQESNIVSWTHEYHSTMPLEVLASENSGRYTTLFWFAQVQPYQDVRAQFNAYVAEGYTDDFFTSTGRQPISVTCYLAVNRKWAAHLAFLDVWYMETMRHTTQDQISFPYVCWKLGVLPYMFPDAHVPGAGHTQTALYIKRNHST